MPHPVLRVMVEGEGPYRMLRNVADGQGVVRARLLDGEAQNVLLFGVVGASYCTKVVVVLRHIVEEALVQLGPDGWRRAEKVELNFVKGCKGTGDPRVWFCQAAT